MGAAEDERGEVPSDDELDEDDDADEDVDDDRDDTDDADEACDAHDDGREPSPPGTGALLASRSRGRLSLECGRPDGELRRGRLCLLLCFLGFWQVSRPFFRSMSDSPPD